MYVKDKILTIVSRNSNLALQQARLVQTKLQTIHPQLICQIIGISTRGDQILDQDLAKIGGKGLFVKELENYLLQDMADIAVHSMKDVPAALPEGLTLGAILQRADPYDVFVSSKFTSFDQLPEGAVIGTSSLRRQAQVLALRPDLKVVSLRGNVETRINKLENGDYAAIILAAAGLARLGLTKWLGCPFSIEQMLPAVGQGALGIEYKQNNSVVQELIEPLNDLKTAQCIFAERRMNELLDGGCQAPIAGFASINNDHLSLRAMVASPDGKIIYRAQYQDHVAQAITVGEIVAQHLIDQGADKIIKSLRISGKLNE